jgi:hypothetical protein
LEAGTIIHSLGDPHAPPFVDVHVRRILDQRLGGEECDFNAVGSMEAFERCLRRVQTVIVGSRVMRLRAKRAWLNEREAERDERNAWPLKIFRIHKATVPNDEGF